MASQDRYFYPGIIRERATIPFMSAAEAWFWFMDAQQAKNEGARVTAGLSLYPRPCEPIDILKTVDRLYRQRRLLMDHLLVLRHYGRRRYSPDPTRVKEMRAARLWEEALDRIQDVLVEKGIVQQPRRNGHAGWAQDALLYEPLAAE